MKIKFTVELIPDDELGFTWEYLAQRIPEQTLDQLSKWLEAQTMAINPKFQTIIYTGDVERFFERKPIID